MKIKLLGNAQCERSWG